MVAEVAAARPSPRQLAILRSIAEFHAGHGYGPSVRDLSIAVGYASAVSGSLWYQLQHLRRAGLIICAPETTRSTRLTDAGWQVLGGQVCACCGQRMEERA